MSNLILAAIIVLVIIYICRCCCCRHHAPRRSICDHNAFTPSARLAQNGLTPRDHIIATRADGLEYEDAAPY